MTRSRSADGSYLFDRFQLSADGTLLLRDGVAIALAPKVLQILLVLVQRAGQVVRKEDLIEAVWPDRFVEETGLTRNISLLRRALGREGQDFVATVARIGYRFAIPVARIETSAVSSAPVQIPHTGVDRSGSDQGHVVLGRDAELTRLIESFEQARRGHGGIVAITGEPGIGKTTVVETFARQLNVPHYLGRGRCSERLASAEPHLPILEALDEIAVADASLIDTLRVAAPTWAQHVAHSNQAPLTPVDAADVQGTGSPERLMRELTSFLEAATRRQPIVIVVEDLHWADVATIDVLAHLASRLNRINLLVVVTYRQREMLIAQHPFARLRGELIARNQLVEIPVSLLTLEDIREYLGHAFGDAPVPLETVVQVFQRTEGNPLFVVEVVRYLRRKGLEFGVSSLTRDVPDSLRGLIDRGLQGLDPVTRQLLSIAAVQGYEWDSATVARVSGVSASEVEERIRTADHIHGLVRFEREDELPDGSLTLLCRFVHVLYQDALIGSIAPSKRTEWARQIADILLQSHANRSDSIAGSLAVLFETGREFWKASQFFLITSQHAARLFAWATASELAHRGLKCLNSAREKQPEERSRRELDLTFARLLPLSSLQGYASPEVERLTQRVVELSDQLSDVPGAAAALGATWLVRMVRGDCLAAKEAGVRLAALGASTQSDVLLMNGHMQAQIACHHLGEFHNARDHAATVIALADRASHIDRCIGILDPIVASVAESSRNRWITGHLARALSDCEAAVTLGRELRHPDSLAFAWLFHAWIHGYQRKWARCLASSEEGIAIARESGSVQTLAWNRCVRGWALAHMGDVSVGHAEVIAGIEDSQAIMGQVALPQFIAMMAEVLLLQEDLGAAETWLARAIEFETSHDDRYFAAEVRRLSGLCLLKRGRRDDARSGVYDALRIAQEQGAVTFELRAALGLAQIDRRDGHHAVREVLARFPEPESWPDLTAAQTLG